MQKIVPANIKFISHFRIKLIEQVIANAKIFTLIIIIVYSPKTGLVLQGYTFYKALNFKYQSLVIITVTCNNYIYTIIILYYYYSYSIIYTYV